MLCKAFALWHLRKRCGTVPRGGDAFNIACRIEKSISVKVRCVGAAA